MMNAIVIYLRNNAIPKEEADLLLFLGVNQSPHGDRYEAGFEIILQNFGITIEAMDAILQRMEGRGILSLTVQSGEIIEIWWGKTMTRLRDQRAGVVS